MVDPKAKKQELRSALQAQDPNRVAKAFHVPPIATTKQGREPQKSPKDLESFIVDDADYGSAVTALLDAIIAAEAVRCSSLSFDLGFGFLISANLYDRRTILIHHDWVLLPNSKFLILSPASPPYKHSCLLFFWLLLTCPVWIFFFFFILLLRMILFLILFFSISPHTTILFLHQSGLCFQML